MLFRSPSRLSYRKSLPSDNSSTTPRAPPPKSPPTFSFHLIHPVSPCTHHNHLHTSITPNQQHLLSSTICRQLLSTCHHHHLHPPPNPTPCHRHRLPCPPLNPTTQLRHHNHMVAAPAATATIPIEGGEATTLHQVDNATTHPILSSDTTTGGIVIPVVLTPPM